MPTYEYQCVKCGRGFEREQKMKDAVLTDCPFDGCGGKVKRLVSAGTGIIFKGSGFYETDYKQKNGCGSSSTCPNSATCPAAKG